MPRTRTSSAGQAAPTASRIDGDLVARAYRKVMDGQELTKQERDALKRHERDREESLRWQYYQSIPQKHWRRMSGRQAKVINEQATRYGIPFGGPTIALPDAVKALHDFLADNAVKLARDDDVLMQGGASPALERYCEERALIARFDRLERERKLLPRDEVRQALGRIAAIVREAGETLQRQFGSGAAEILHDALEGAEREVGRCFGEGEEHEQHAPANGPPGDDDPGRGASNHDATDHEASDPS